ncbi:MAG: hypothetical protein ABWY05_04230 [Noviherbaspirillum sp.]
MSRLFSRLENIGEGRGDNELSPPHVEAAAPAAAPAEPDAAPAPARADGMQSVLPGYAISSRLSVAPAPPMQSPVWPLRLWFFSLVFLIALSLLMLVVPERLYSPSQQKQAPVVLQPEATPLAPARAAPPSPAVLETAPPPASADTPVPVPVPAAPTPRPEPRVIAAPVPPAPVQAHPAAPASGAAACSEAMLALSLCTPISP